MTPTEMLKLANILRKICDEYESFQMVRDEVETKWAIEYKKKPTKKQVEKLEGMFWTHNPEENTFSRYF